MGYMRVLGEKGTVPICAQHPSGCSGKWGLSPFLMRIAIALCLLPLVGCSDGRYLSQFQQAGWEVAGVEVSEFSAKEASKRLGIDIHRRPLEELDLGGETFDLIRLKHCIEHLPDPCSTIRKAAHLLRPGGFAVVDTDNAEGLRSKTENLIRALLGRSLSRLPLRRNPGRARDPGRTTRSPG